MTLTAPLARVFRDVPRPQGLFKRASSEMNVYDNGKEQDVTWKSLYGMSNDARALASGKSHDGANAALFQKLSAGG